MDTCQNCSMYTRKIQDLERSIAVGSFGTCSKANLQKELLNLKAELDKHLQESEIRYGAIAYDTNVLAASN